ncbi:hypothetical protein [Levilactobacillus brevis]|uniref:hypothetical protein n=1 Tax=Levilactobacillus brevis TaxID=1580 RepID=UPI002073659C|nr:hypothetical protein [Levilactobacillus brevis]
MPNKKPNILQRRGTGAVKPSEEYHADNKNTQKEKKCPSIPKNQEKSIKVSAEPYKDMSEEQQRRYTVLRENM